MMKKKLLAALTALCCVSSMASLAANAAYTMPDYLVKGDAGYLYQVTDYYYLMIESDGRAITEDVLDNPESVNEIIFWDDFQLHCYTSVEKTPGENAYMIGTTHTTEEELVSWARSQAVHLNEGEDAYLFCMKKSAPAIPYDIGITLNDSAVELDETLLPAEISEQFSLEIINGSYRLSPKAYQEHSLKEASALYDEYSKMTEELMKIYAGLIASAKISCSVLEAPSQPEGSVIDIWTGAGDLDTDGKIDASDAAALLVLSAMRGATVNGGADPFTAEQKSAADLNGDTFCDANDAAYILQFAAEAGAGSELSIGEFMTRK
ncbi:MAG: hypothetical protein E7511_03955 [Ruminococcus sp.]|nr:hypothetical protein [Ruminococcus sp.]